MPKSPDLSGLFVFSMVIEMRIDIIRYWDISSASTWSRFLYFHISPEYREANIQYRVANIIFNRFQKVYFI